MLSARDGQVNGDYKANVIPDKEKEWPSSFWLLLKVLGLFYYESAVTERKCFPCHAKKFMEDRSRNQIKAMDINIDYLVLAYELESKREDEDEETRLLLSTNQNDDEEEEGEQNAVCTACESLWWNCDGVAERYTDKTIGFRRWYHKGEKFLSTAWLLCALCLLVYGLYLIIPRLFAKPDQILHLILKMTFYCAIVAPILLLFCSKIRSCFKFNVRKLGWASSLNLRYLIRRAQILDLPKRGLPGKPFLFICICLPTTVSAYRYAIFLFMGDCGVTFEKVLESVFGTSFMIGMGLVIYLLYFIRVSFQCHFNILLKFIKENDGDLTKCKGVLFGIVAEFTCYSQLCGLYTALLFPVVVLAIVANLTWDYMSSGACVSQYAQSAQTVQMHLMVLAWIEIIALLSVYLCALGGLNVQYLWDDFITNIVLMRSKQCSKPCDDVLKQLKQLITGSNALIFSIIGTVTATYMGFNLGQQNIAFLTESCNGTFANYHCG
ncbi:hypothetical protein BSL78_20719 [Apostichopus japonicus]|uniref:Uncharacterized protein n=2 Tax=Stichopus japonicus TaxID=307972 RepID=A0A2G8K379_STIJA|nr:hypothetical protein BSL78_20719 [Apostichopus japonicus]